MNRKVKLITTVGVLSALSIVLYFIEFSLFGLFPPYLKIDLSDVPAILAGIAFGPIAGVGIELIKNIAHLLVLGVQTPFGSGEIGNFFAGIGLMLPIAITIRKTGKHHILPYVLGTISMALLANLMNYFVSFPLYGIPAEQRWPTIVSATLPFNIVKAVIVSIITAALYSRLKAFFERLRY